MKKRLLATALSVAMTVMIVSESSYNNRSNCIEESDALFTNKTVSVNSDGTYNIKLESYANGKITTKVDHIPNDIILVLDKSASMGFSSTSYETVKTLPDTRTNEEWYEQEELFFIPDGTQEYIPIDVSRNLQMSMTYMFKYRAEETLIGTSETKNQETNLMTMIKSIDKYKNGGKLVQAHNLTRLEVLQDTAKGFINKVREDSIKNNVDHKVAVVGFSSENDSAIYDGKDCLYNNNYSDADKTFNTCLKKVSDDKFYNDSIASINALESGGATHAASGMKLAEKIIEKNPSKTRNRVVIYISDGVPTKDPDTWDEALQGVGNSFQVGVADGAVQFSEHIKQTSKVYTIGMFQGADVTQCPPMNQCDTEIKKVNRFMNIMSSNHPHATTMENGGATDNTTGYYLEAKTKVDLDNVFETIKSEIVVSGSSLGKEAVVKDVVSQYFDIPAGTKPTDIAVSTVDCTGKNSDGTFTFNENNKTSFAGAVKTISGNTVGVTGFDYSAFCCQVLNGKAQGKKLIVEFKVKPKDGFMGGNNVPTNDYVLKDGKVKDLGQSGIYGDNTTDIPLKTFNTPVANVPINISLTCDNANIYAGNSCPDLIELINNIPGSDDWRADYITVEKTATAKNTFDSLHDNKGYEFTVTVNPKISYDKACNVGEKQKAVQSDCKADIYVFAPVIPCADSTIYLGQKAPAYEGTNITLNNKPVLWKHGNKYSTEVLMYGEKPEFKYDFSVAPGYFEKDTPVAVNKVMNGEVDIKSVSLFTNDAAQLNGYNFTVHVKTCKITVQKTGADSIYGGNRQSFVFNVKGSGNIIADKVDMTVVLTSENLTKMVTGLPVGKYIITEDSGWSWRYEASPSENNISSDKTSVKFILKNSIDDKKWFDGNCYAENVFNAKKEVSDD